MESSSRETLSKVFEEIIEWKKRRGRARGRGRGRRRRNYTIPDEVKFHWSEAHLSVVHGYVLKLDLNSDLRILSTAKYFNTLWYGMPGSSMVYATTVASFTQELQEFFIVPTPQQLFDRESTLKKNEIVSGFISFLIQLLYHKTDYIDPFKDGIESLEKELRFLVTVLKDTSLLCDEHEQVQNLLAEFEAVANEAGSLLYSFFFSMDPVFETMGESLVVILSHIDLLKANIIKFLNLSPFIAKANVTPNTAAVDSLFIVDSLLSDLQDLLNQDGSLIVDEMDQIKILHQELMFSQSLLKGIKVPPLSQMKELKEPVIRIRDGAYEAEYLINSFLVGDAPPWYFSIRLPHVIHKIKLIGIELQEIKKNHDIGALKIAKNFGAQLQTMRNSEVDDITVGLEDKAIDILDHLVGGTEHLKIISIFGMPGLGKTTLAKKLYNHPSVTYRFDKRSWCVVYHTYQRRSVLIDILISSTSEIDKDMILNMEEENLVEHIYKSLKGRRYLIVMDDIWGPNAWDDLRRCFPDDGNGSRILFTSRNKDVAPPNSIIYALPPLSNDQCWELLEKKVFRNKHCPLQLLWIGRKVAANCCGLPLAVVVTAGILATMDKKESIWKDVGENLASHIFDGENNFMIRILELSYKNLPDHLKTCFLYFGAFPKGTEIPVHKLMRLWIAEGFIHKEEKKNAESTAEEYLLELIDKSLVVVAKRRSDGGVKACIIHDLLRDLCLRRAEEENFLKLMENNYTLYTKHHHLCVHMNPISKAWPQFLLPFGLHGRSFFGSLPDSSSLYVLNMKLLRVLDLQNTRSIHGDLDGIELLLHLRYLAITFMPASIGSLVNLEFLVVETSYIVVIPAAIFKMMRLRCLHLTNQAIFDKDCNSSQTNNLEYLSNVRIYTLKDEVLLNFSPHLHKLKGICGPLWVGGEEAYRYPDFRFLTQLESLKMGTWRTHETAEIRLPLNIKKLTLSNWRFPWEKMSIIGGLPNLQVLKLTDNAFVGETWDTRDGQFQKLRVLKLVWLGLAQWNIDSSHYFPKLQKLVLRNCHKLQEIPSEVGEIVTLQLIEVQGWRTKSVQESAIQIQQEQRDIGNEELRIIFGKPMYACKSSPHF